MLLVTGSLLDHSDICIIETRPIVEPWYIAGILKFRPEFQEFHEFYEIPELTLNASSPRLVIGSF